MDLRSGRRTFSENPPPLEAALYPIQEEGVSHAQDREESQGVQDPSSNLNERERDLVRILRLLPAAERDRLNQHIQEIISQGNEASRSSPHSTPHAQGPQRNSTPQQGCPETQGRSQPRLRRQSPDQANLPEDHAVQACDGGAASQPPHELVADPATFDQRLPQQQEYRQVPPPAGYTPRNGPSQGEPHHESPQHNRGYSQLQHMNDERGQRYSYQR